MNDVITSAANPVSHKCLKGWLNEREAGFAFLFRAFVLFVNLLFFFLCCSFLTVLSCHLVLCLYWFISYFFAYCFTYLCLTTLSSPLGKTGQGSMSRDIYVATPSDF